MKLSTECKIPGKLRWLSPQKAIVTWDKNDTITLSTLDSSQGGAKVVFQGSPAEIDKVIAPAFYNGFCLSSQGKSYDVMFNYAKYDAGIPRQATDNDIASDTLMIVNSQSNPGTRLAVPFDTPSSRQRAWLLAFSQAGVRVNMSPQRAAAGLYDVYFGKTATFMMVLLSLLIVIGLVVALKK